MKALCRGLILLAGLTPAFAADLNGTWYIWFAGDVPSPDHNDKGFDLTVRGDNVIGQAYLGKWGGFPGYPARSTGHFSFTGTIRFEGAVNGKQLKITAFDPDPREMEGMKVESTVTGPVSVNASDKDVTGKWESWFVGPIGIRHKTFSEVTLDLALKGSVLTGTAHVGGWPGDANLSEGRFEGGHFSFTAIGQLPSSDGYPRFQFEGTIHGKELKLTMDGNNPLDGKKLE